jgi:hypothetical protein
MSAADNEERKREDPTPLGDSTEYEILPSYPAAFVMPGSRGDFILACMDAELALERLRPFEGTDADDLDRRDWDNIYLAYWSVKRRSSL